MLKTKNLNFLDNKFRIELEEKIEKEELPETILSETKELDKLRLELRGTYLRKICILQTKILENYIELAVRYNNGEVVLPDMDYDEFKSLTDVLITDYYAVVSSLYTNLSGLYIKERTSRKNSSKSSDKAFEFYDFALDNYYDLKDKLFNVLSTDVEKQIFALEDDIKKSNILEISVYLKEDWLNNSTNNELDFSILDCFISNKLEILFTTYDMMSLSGISEIPKYKNNFKLLEDFKLELLSDIREFGLDDSMFKDLSRCSDDSVEFNKYIDDLIIYLFK